MIGLGELACVVILVGVTGEWKRRVGSGGSGRGYGGREEGRIEECREGDERRNT